MSDLKILPKLLRSHSAVCGTSVYFEQGIGAWSLWHRKHTDTPTSILYTSITFFVFKFTLFIVVYYKSRKRELNYCLLWINKVNNCLLLIDKSFCLLWINKSLFVYYESIKREPKIRGIYECRCDERLQTKSKEFTRLAYTGLYAKESG